MSFNSNQFRNAFKQGFAKPNLFRVQILGISASDLSTPLTPERDAFASVSAIAMNNLEFSCYECELPGKLIGSTTYKDYGVPVEVPYGGIYSPVNMNFYVSSDMIQKEFFTAWHEYIVSNNLSSDVAYYDDITATVIITQMNEEGEDVFRCVLHEAYPKNVAQMNLSWDTRNDVHKMSVEMTYRHWTGIPL